MEWINATCTNCGKSLKELDKECPRCHGIYAYNDGRFVKAKQADLMEKVKVTDDRKCKRCGKPEVRINGYCSVYCEDMHELEKQCEEMKHGIEAVIIEIEKKAKRVVNKYSDDELSFSSGLYESITIIENHLSKYLDE